MPDSPPNPPRLAVIGGGPGGYAAAFEAARGEAGDDLVVGPNARAGLQVVGIEGNPAEVGNDGLQTRRRIAADPYGLDGFRQRREAVRGAKLHHPGNSLVEAERDPL